MFDKIKIFLKNKHIYNSQVSSEISQIALKF